MSSDDNFYSGRKARGAAAFAAGFRIASLVIGFLVSVILVRNLSESDFGIYNLLYSLVPLVLMVMSFGLDNTVARYVPEFAKVGEFRIAHKITKFAQLIRLVTSSLVILLLFLLWDHWAPLLNLAEYENAFAIFSLILVADLQFRLVTTALSAHLLQKYSFGAQAGLVLVKLVGYASLVAGGLTLIEVLMIDLVGFLIGLVVLIAAYQFRARKVPGNRTHLGKSDRRRVLRYALFYNFNDIGTITLGRRFDNFFIAGVIGPIAVGAYSLATMLLNVAQQLSPVSFFQTVIRPMFFSLDIERDEDRVTKLYQVLIKLVFIVNIPITAFACAYHREILIVVFDGKFLDFAWLIPAVFAFGLFTRISVPVALVAQLAEKAGVILASKIFAVYNIIALIYLLPRFGIMGAVVATGTAFVLKELFIWWHVRQLASFSGTGKFFLISTVLWGLATLLGQLARLHVDGALLNLILGVFMFGLIGLVFVRLPILNSWEQTFLRRQIPAKALRIVSSIIPLDAKSPTSSHRKL